MLAIERERDNWIRQGVGGHNSDGLQSGCCVYLDEVRPLDFKSVLMPVHRVSSWSARLFAILLFLFVHSMSLCLSP